MKRIIQTSLIAAALIAPAFSLAATYDYVDTTGAMRTVSADSVASALVTPGIAAHSGVAIETGIMISNITITTADGRTITPNLYHYVDVNGVVRDVTASSPSEALVTAVNIAPHSGVAADMGLIVTGVTVGAI